MKVLKRNTCYQFSENDALYYREAFQAISQCSSAY